VRSMNAVAPSTALKIARGKVWMYKNDEEGDTHPWRVCFHRCGACQTTLIFETCALARKARGVVVRGIAVTLSMGERF
jgi:hypothetical protein